jgi:hypothetical protein
MVVRAAAREGPQAVEAARASDDASLPPLPPLPATDEHLHAAHYSCELIDNSKASTPPVSAIAVRHLLSGQVWTFAAIRVAEERQIPPTDFLLHLPGLEREVLKRFFECMAAHPEATWLHWGMSKPHFGFDALAQRARALGLQQLARIPERRFDLSNYLKRRFGPEYAPDPRLWHAMQRNQAERPGLLNP